MAVGVFENSPSKIQGLKLVVFVAGYVQQFCLPFIELNYPFICPLHSFIQIIVYNFSSYVWVFEVQIHTSIIREKPNY